MSYYIRIPEDVVDPVDPVTGRAVPGGRLTFAEVVAGLLSDQRFLSSRAAMKLADRLEADLPKMVGGSTYEVRDADFPLLAAVADAPQVAFKPVVRRARCFFDAICDAKQERPE